MGPARWAFLVRRQSSCRPYPSQRGRGAQDSASGPTSAAQPGWTAAMARWIRFAETGYAVPSV
ncbi:MAG: hypothetical protein M3Z83_09890, partial [Actinomycetota bacterium]|nr:hypothetical protein [Actinomycetota bacterium]